MKDIPDDSIDLVVTSPPYDNIRTYNGYSFDWEATFRELYRIIKEGGVVVWIVADQTKNGTESGTSFKQALWAINCGFNLHDTMIWDKGSCAFPDKNRYSNVFEYMFVFSKGKPKTANLICDKPNKWADTKIHGTERQADGTLKQKSGKQKNKTVKRFGARNNIWHINAEKRNTTLHPAVFPIEIAEGHILTWSNEGDVVLDCFMGSGTTGIACINNNRDFIGIEIDDTYFNVAKQRINEAQDFYRKK